LWPPSASAQHVFSNDPSVSVNLTVGQSVTVSVDSNTITLDPGTGVGAPSINITTAWQVNNTAQNIITFAYFTGATALTGTNPSNTVPSSQFSASLDGSAFVVASSGGIPANAAAGGLGWQASANKPIHFPAAGLANSQTDSFTLKVNNLSAIPADTYTGTLLIEAQIS
jgi:hypothetical protein